MPDDDFDAFAAFYDDFLPPIYRYVYYRVGDVATAEDLTSAIFEKALRAWGTRHQPNALEPWIFRIARNTIISYYRHAGRRNQVPLDEIVETHIHTDKRSPEIHMLQTERWSTIQKTIQTLSQREQHIITLKFGSGLTNRAIAPIVGTSEGNVAIVLHRALRKILARLTAEQGKEQQ